METQFDTCKSSLLLSPVKQGPSVVRGCLLVSFVIHVTEVGTDSAQIQHSTDSVGGKKAPVEGNLYDPFSPRNDVTKR